MEYDCEYIIAHQERLLASIVVPTLSISAIELYL